MKLEMQIGAEVFIASFTFWVPIFGDIVFASWRGTCYGMLLWFAEGYAYEKTRPLTVDLFASYV